ncbi:MAG: iron uptake system protein EfeO, partial [Myxococcota bacterium]
MRAGVAAAAALLTGISLVGCQAKEAETPGTGGGDGGAAPAQITVTASDDTCELSGTTATTGPSTFLITNNGTKVTEFYVYGAGDRVMGEVENVSPGLERKLIVQLTEPGKYQTACKPGMIGDGLRGDFTVTGDAVQIDTEGKFKEAADDYERYVNSQTDALVAATDVFVAAVKKGDVAAAKAQFPIARTYYERIEPVAESFPNDLDPRIDLREADLEPGQKWTGFHALEKQLWVTGLQPDANALADQLAADVKELNDGVKAPDFTIDSTQIAGGAQGLLDEIASSKI